MTENARSSSPHDDFDARPRVLLADDSRTNQSVGVRMLDRLGCHVEVVSNGVEAVAACAAVNYDVVFMDVHMPILDGFAATQEIRRTQTKDHEPWIIALTASVSDEEHERCRRAGMDDFIVKPVRLEALRDALVRAIAQRTYKEVVLSRPPASQYKVLDLSVLEELGALTAERNPGFLLSLLESYQRDGSHLVDNIERAVTEGDWAGVLRAAHTLKGASATIGALVLPELCAALESFTVQPFDAIRRSAEIRRAHEELLEALTTRIRA